MPRRKPKPKPRRKRGTVVDPAFPDGRFIAVTADSSYASEESAQRAALEMLERGVCSRVYVARVVKTGIKAVKTEYSWN